MTNEPLNIRQIFDVAAELASEADRRAYLDKVCAGAPDLRRKIDALLDAHAAAGSFLEPPDIGATLDSLDTAPISEQPGTVIGRYKLLEQIGEGGFGVVFMAEQTEPVERRVALKVIKAGMDTRQVIARFQAERQALALMDHSNIARVFDGGSTDTGRPYFVMELVRGIPITEYCDRYNLSTRDRLALFATVCQAVQHAHQKGVIHRDIKPNNVMVTLHDGKPVVKVIDFGVAKAINQRLTERTLFTNFAQMVGTPLYMSPEQAELSGLDVDTRSDIYSLGVLLYELLTGTTPFDRQRLAAAAYDEIRRIIRDEEPPRPSTRISTLGDALAGVAAHRHIEPRRLSALMRGELDWIVMKALEKDRGRRYETANALAMDVQCYLSDEAVKACPPSTIYRFRKFARRNKRLLATVTLFGLMLVAVLGVVAGGLGWVAADREARMAKTANEVTQFLSRADALYEESKLPEAIAEVEKAGGVLATTDTEGDLKQRVDQWRTDLATSVRLDDVRLEWADHFELDRRQADYARVFREYGIDIDVLSHDEAVKRIAASRIKFDLVGALYSWSWLPQPQDQGRSPQLTRIAESVDPDPRRLRLRKAADAQDLKILRAAADAMDIASERPRRLAFMGYALQGAGDLDGAIAFTRQAQREHPADYTLNTLLAGCLEVVKPSQLDEAIGFRRAAIAVRPQSVASHRRLGGALFRLDRLEEAIAEYRRALALRPDDVASLAGLGAALVDTDQPAEALPYLRHAVRLKPDFAYARMCLGRALRAVHLLDEGIVELREAVRLSPGDAFSQLSLGFALHDRRRPDEAAAAYRAAAEAYPEQLRRYPADAIVRVNFARALLELDRLDEAIVECREAIRLKPESAYAHHQLGLILQAKGDADGAVAAYREAIRLEPQDANNHNSLGNVLRDDKDLLDEAIAAYRQAVRLDPLSSMYHCNLGAALEDRDELKEAESVLREALRLEPDSAHIWCELSTVLHRTDRLEDCIAAIHQAIRLEPDYALAHQHLGLAFRMNSQLDESIAAYLEAICLDPDDANIHIGLGATLQAKRLTDEAIAAFREAIRLAPQSASAHNNLGVTLRTKGLLDEAIAACRHAISLKPDYDAAWNNLGNALKDHGRTDEAVDAYRNAIRFDPDSAPAHNNLGSALQQSGLLDDAIAAHREAIRLMPDFAAAHNDLGVALRNKGQVDEAIASYHEAVRLSPNESLYHRNLGRALESKQLWDEAITEHREAVRFNPTNASYHNNLGALLCDRKRDYVGAVAAFREAIRLRSDDAVYHCNLGNALLGNGDLDESIAAYREANRLNPDNAKTHRLLGAAFNQSGKPNEAIAAFQRSIELDPNDPWSYAALGMFLDDQGDAEKAIDAYTEAARLAPDESIIQNNFGRTLGRHGRPNDAMARFRKAIQLDPTNALAHRNLGEALISLKRVDEGIAELHEAIRRDAGDALAYRLLGETLCDEKHDFDAAVAAQREAIRLNPDDALAYRGLGIALARLGKTDEAIVCYHQAMKRSPHDVTTHQLLGEGLREKGDLKGALAAYGEARRLKPDDAFTLDAISRLLVALGQFDEAIALARRVADLDPDSADARARLSVLLNNSAWKLVTDADPKQRNATRALDLINEANKLLPDAHMNTLGAVHYRLGDLKAASKAIEASMKTTNGGNSYDWFFLAMIRWQQNEKEEARTQYDQAVQWMEKHQPQNEELRRFQAEASQLLGAKEGTE